MVGGVVGVGGRGVVGGGAGWPGAVEVGAAAAVVVVMVVVVGAAVVVVVEVAAVSRRTIREVRLASWASSARDSVSRASMRSSSWTFTDSCRSFIPCASARSASACALSSSMRT